MGRPILVGVVVALFFLVGCSHCPPTPTQTAAAENEATPSAPSPVEEDQEETRETLRRYTWHDNWLENYPVLGGTVTLMEMWMLNALMGLGDLPPMLPSPPPTKRGS
jgi:hypothetical protein